MNPHLANAIWLVSVLPFWYFSPVAHPLREGILSLIPFVGTLGLVAGIVIGVFQRRPRLFVFLLPVVVSECYVAIAGSLRGQVRGNVSLVPLSIFVVVQMSLMGFLVYRLKGTRLAALSLALFGTSYALFALFVGGMSFADDWL